MTAVVAQSGDPGWRAEARDACRTHAALGALVLAYLLIACLVAAAFGQLGRISPFLYNSRFNILVLLYALAFLFVQAIRIMVVQRPARPIEAIAAAFRVRYLTRRRLFNAIPVIILLSVFTSVFTSLKAMIPLMHPYSWDTTLMHWDMLLHFGVPPWVWLQPMLGTPWVTGAMSVVYGSWIFVVSGCCFWQTFTERDPPLRMQFLFTYVLCFAVLGNLAATWLASGGPCFYGRLVAGPDPYAPLLAYLDHAYQRVPLDWSTGAQTMLWRSYTTGILELGSGISAMPSLHVAGATMCALLGWRSSSLLGGLLTLYTVLIMIGSVHLGWHYAVDGYVAVSGSVVIWFGVGGVLRWSMIHHSG
jgi:hypothetical protein